MEVIILVETEFTFIREIFCDVSKIKIGIQLGFQFGLTFQWSLSTLLLFGVF